MVKMYVRDGDNRFILQTVGTGPQGPPGEAGGIQSIVAGDNITVDATDPDNPIVSSTGGGGSGDVQSVNDIEPDEQGNIDLDQDDIPDGTTAKQYTQTEKTKLAGIETGAEVNNISDADANELTGNGNTPLHFHSSDRARDNHTGEQAINTVTGLQSELNEKQDLAEKDQAEGYPGLDTDGKINPSQLPAIALGNVFVVASQVAMLALPAVVGDVAIRTDENKSYILAALPASTLGNWQELLVPIDQVQSVYGRQGNVTAQNGDYTASQVTNTPNGSIAATTVQTAIDELNSEKQPLDADLTALAAAGNSGVLANTTASFLTADETKLDGIEAGADVTDATNVAAAGAFMKATDDTDDITEGATNKFLTAAEETKLAHITVTQPVDLDTMESDITAVEGEVVELESKTVPEEASIMMRDPAMSAWYADLKLSQTKHIDMVVFGDSITVGNTFYDVTAGGGWPYYVANRLYNIYNVNSTTAASVVNQDGFRYANPAGGIGGGMNGTVGGSNASGIHIGVTSINGGFDNTLGLMFPTDAALTGNYASTPDAAALDITGDVSLSMVGSLQDWTPTAQGTIVGKWQSSGQFSYKLDVGTNGRPIFSWTTDGTTVLSLTCTVSPAFTDLVLGGLAVQFDADNGASGRTAKFYKSTNGTTWTLIDTVTSATATTIHSGTSQLAIAANTAGTAGGLKGKYNRVQVYSGLRDFAAGSGGTLVFDANFATQTLGATSFTESSSNAATVTVTAPAGTDAYVFTLCGAGTRMADGNSATHTAWASGVYVVFNGGGGTLTVKTGGSGGTTRATINTNSAPYTGRNINVVWVDLASYANHEIWIGNTVAPTLFSGICTTAGNKLEQAGILFWRMGRSGTSNQFFSQYPDRGLTLIERLKEVTTYEPHVINALAFNDARDFEAQLTEMINQIRTRTNGSIAQWGIWATTAAQNAKIPIIAQVAASMNLALVDSAKAIGNVSAYADISAVSPDDIHPNDNGIIAIATQMLALLTGNPIAAAIDVLYNFPNRNLLGRTLTLTSNATVGGNLVITGTSSFSGMASFTNMQQLSPFSTASLQATTVLSLTMNAASSGGKIIINDTFGAPLLALSNATADTQFALAATDDFIMNILFGIASAGFALGAGGSTAPDTGMGRLYAGVWAIRAATAAELLGVGGVEYTNATAVGNVGTGEDDLRSYTIPANVLGTNLEYIEGEASGTIANNANAKRIRIKYGATTILDTGASGLPASVAASWIASWKVIRTGAATQRVIGELKVGNGTTYPFIANTTAAETLSGTVVMKLTGEATTTDDIVQNFMSLKWQPANT